MWGGSVGRLATWTMAGLFCIGLTACGGGGGNGAVMLAPGQTAASTQVFADAAGPGGGAPQPVAQSGIGNQGASQLSLIAGDIGGPGSVDGSGAAARFYGPQAIAADGAGNLYVADAYNDTIRKITRTGMVSTLAGSAGQYGSADVIGAAAR